MELIFCNALAHRTRATDASTNHLQQLIRIVGTAPLLVREHITADLALAALHELDVCLHALSRIRARKEVADVRVRVQTAEL